MKWRDIFRSNWFLKLISLGFAILLWFLVGGEEMVQVTISIPLEITNVPADMVIANDIPPSLAVKLYGPRTIINSITQQRLSKVIDLKGTHTGRLTVDITPSRLALPAGVTAMKIDPASITILLERRLTKVVPVSAELTGYVENDYEPAKVTILPSQVRISGPESEVSKIRKLKTYPIDLGRATKTFSREIGLDLQELHATVDGDGIVKVEVEIRPLEGSRRFQHVKVTGDSRQGELTWWPSEITVILEGAKPVLKKLTSEDIIVKIPDDIKQGKQWLAPVVMVDQGLVVRKTIPETVRITLNKKNTDDIDNNK